MRYRTLGEVMLIVTLVTTVACKQSKQQTIHAATAASASPTTSIAANKVGDIASSVAARDAHAETRKYHVLCTSRQHIGGWCKQYDTLREADAALAKHRKETGHADNGRSAGKCPVVPDS